MVQKRLLFPSCNKKIGTKVAITLERRLKGTLGGFSSFNKAQLTKMKISNICQKETPIHILSVR